MKKKQIYSTSLSFFMALLSCSCIFISCQNSKENQTIIEKFTYYTEDSIPIKSTLYLPSHKINKIIVELNYIDIQYVHPDFTSPFDSIIHQDILTFTSNNIGVMRISPRATVISNNIQEAKKLTLNTLAEDAVNACRFLRQDSRFRKIPIGVKGYSNGGIAAAKAVTRNKDFDFALLIATPGIPSVDIRQYYWKNTDFLISYKNFFSNFRKFFPKDHFIYENKIYRATEEKSADELFEECIWNCTNEINRKIVLKEKDPLLIQENIKKELERAFHTESISVKIDTKELGISYFTKDLNRASINDFLDVAIKNLYTPQEINFLQWNPEEYYPKIEVPVLMLSGEKDTYINAGESISNTKQIVDKYGKTNFTIEVIPGADHHFRSLNSKEATVEYGHGERKIKLQDKLYFETILSWLNQM
ncbi:MAG: dienelactone hydrolase family protein [Bacteroidales bacterium]|nr:dienelactone hydrolase family protein [Bacteroidales bacterium]